jgi:hypothetical protein
MTNLTHFFIYFISLHVSSITMLIIRRSNCINTSSGMISLSKWLLGMPVLKWCVSISSIFASFSGHCVSVMIFEFRKRLVIIYINKTTVSVSKRTLLCWPLKVRRLLRDVGRTEKHADRAKVVPEHPILFPCARWWWEVEGGCWSASRNSASIPWQSAPGSR